MFLVVCQDPAVIYYIGYHAPITIVMYTCVELATLFG